MIPFEPEPIAAMQARYPAAVAELLTRAMVTGPDAYQPGALRRHVFDHEDGLRLIVSRENFYPEWGEIIHVSASVHDDRAVAQRIMNMRSGPRAQMETFMILAYAAFERLSQTEWRVARAVMTEPKGIPHWFLQPLEEPRP
jgi:hypothetical protein